MSCFLTAQRLLDTLAVSREFVLLLPGNRETTAPTPLTAGAGLPPPQAASEPKVTESHLQNPLVLQTPLLGGSSTREISCLQSKELDVAHPTHTKLICFVLTLFANTCMDIFSDMFFASFLVVPPVFKTLI